MAKSKKIVLSVVCIILVIAFFAASYLGGWFVHWGVKEKQIMVQDDYCSIEAQIDGKYISSDEMGKWIKKRIRYVEKQLDLEPRKTADLRLLKLAETVRCSRSFLFPIETKMR